MFSWLLPNDSRSSLSDFREISRSGPPLAGPPRGPGGPADIQGENLSVSVLPAGPSETFSSLIPRFVFVQLISAGSPGSPLTAAHFHRFFYLTVEAEVCFDSWETRESFFL